MTLNLLITAAILALALASVTYFEYTEFLACAAVPLMWWLGDRLLSKA